MATKIAKTRIKRAKSTMYFIKDGAVWGVPRKRPGSKAKGKKKKIVQFAGKKGLDYSKHIYYLDKDGDVAAAKRKKR